MANLRIHCSKTEAVMKNSKEFCQEVDFDSYRVSIVYYL